MKLQTPDTTRAQAAVYIGAIAGLANAFGIYHLSGEQTTALVAVLGLLLGSHLFDTVLRVARAKFLGAKIGSLEHEAIEAASELDVDEPAEQ